MSAMDSYSSYGPTDSFLAPIPVSEDLMLHQKRNEVIKAFFCLTKTKNTKRVCVNIK